MKLIFKTFAFLLLLTFALPGLDAKTLEFVLNHTTQKNVHISEHTPQQLKIENIGNQPIKNCFPYANQAPSTSLEALAFRLAGEKHPLLALYHLWNQSIVQDPEIGVTHCHPLDLLNFKGACSPEDFNFQFVKLCNALGIETRLVNIKGKTLYDFCLDDEWHLLDLSHNQIYLSLDNEKVVSSETLMDDPFLALRTKHSRQAQGVNFKENWKQLAHFEILEPSSAIPVMLAIETLQERSVGINLYPSETLEFTTQPEWAKYQCLIAYHVNLEQRSDSLCWDYHSPFPIQKIVNESSVTLRLMSQELELLPGESWSCDHQENFHLSLAFTAPPKGHLLISGICAYTLFPCLKEGQNQIYLGSEENPSNVRFCYTFDENLEKTKLQVLNQHTIFDYRTPTFELENLSHPCEKIVWQISADSNFKLVPPNFEQMEIWTSQVTLPLISETFLNPGETYYFRVKGFCQGEWGAWSVPYAFVVNKPLAVEEVEFDRIDDNHYELNWERRAEITEEPIEYLVFGSNALDFVPSIYCDKQVNAVVNGEVTEEEVNDNLVAITTDLKIKVSGDLAYYRIIAKQHGQLSVPSTLIHVYDQNLIQPRTILQVIDSEHEILTKRVLFPAHYEGEEIALPHFSHPFSQKNSLIKIQALLRAATSIASYEYPDVTEEIWEEVRPYLLPANHPAWPMLHRVFCKSRATQNPDMFKKAGFKRWRPGRWSRVSASSHPEFNAYFIKAYCDCELGILYDWKKWIHRIEGAKFIRECIKNNQLQQDFKVPKKWIYPLPKNPAPPKNSHHIRKNFILVCENMRIQEHDQNEKMYKKKMTRKILDGVYIILQSCGLCDSVYCFNIPFCKDGRIAVIDTEYHHKWPVPFPKLSKCFSKDMRAYWDKITYKGGRIPNGINQYNPPRNDRRDIPKP